MPASLIYHIAARADWERALRDGAYVTSTRGVTLAEQGYIHASEAAQVAGIANAFYTGTGEDLVLLVIDPARVQAEIRYEDVPGVDAPFPHIYGALNPDAVTAVLPFAPGPDSAFTFTP
jgi:glutathione S-transferase